MTHSNSILIPLTVPSAPCSAPGKRSSLGTAVWCPFLSHRLWELVIGTGVLFLSWSSLIMGPGELFFVIVIPSLFDPSVPATPLLPRLCFRPTSLAPLARCSSLHGILPYPQRGENARRTTGMHVCYLAKIQSQDAACVMPCSSCAKVWCRGVYTLRRGGNHLIMFFRRPDDPVCSGLVVSTLFSLLIVYSYAIVLFRLWVPFLATARERITQRGLLSPQRCVGQIFHISFSS